MSAICGLVGAWAAPRKGERNVGLMLDVLRPRGPDHAVMSRPSQQGHSPPVMLGLRQLKVRPDEPEAWVVVDREAGHTLVADGRVFNGDAVRAFLAGRGCSLLTEDDAELFLRLYQEEGLAGFRRVDGQYAVAIWDARRGELVLARDPLGVRSAYYTYGRDGVAFASEIKALLAVPEVPVAADPVAVSHYLTFLTVPGPRTLFADVRRVPAGSAVVFRNLRPEVEELWSLLDDPIDEVADESFYVDRARSLHDDAVTGRMERGPVAALLSGGNGSSANAALLARKMPDSGELHTFTVGLAERDGNERDNDLHYARQVATIIKSRHHERLLTVSEFISSIPVTIEALDDLVSEPSSVFLHHGLALTKETGLRVVVTGDANDELSCGHGEMIRIREGYYKRWLRWNELPSSVKSLAARLCSLVDPRHTELLRRAAAGQEYFWNYEIAWPESELGQILDPQALRFALGEPPHAFVDRDAARLRASAHGNRDYLNHIIYRMMQDYYFGNLMLGKLDLLAARLGIEPRCPYTAPAYAHFVYNIPASFKQQGGVLKPFFKKAIAGLLPDEIIHRPKQALRTPVVALFRGALGDFARPVLLEEGLTRAGLLRREALAGLLAAHRAERGDYSNKLWTAMTLNLWHRRWIESGRPQVRPAPHTIRLQEAMR